VADSDLRRLLGGAACVIGADWVGECPRVGRR
jgi:hypothetical protein